jgi:hypothetical protein
MLKISLKNKSRNPLTMDASVSEPGSITRSAFLSSVRRSEADLKLRRLKTPEFSFVAEFGWHVTGLLLKERGRKCRFIARSILNIPLLPESQEFGRRRSTVWKENSKTRWLPNLSCLFPESGSPRATYDQHD